MHIYKKLLDSTELMRRTPGINPEKLDKLEGMIKQLESDVLRHSEQVIMRRF